MEKSISNSEKNRIAILGGGPSALFAYKRLVESGQNNFEISIFEKRGQLGAGMPYSLIGANDEHVTNVSDNEIPKIVTHIHEWIHSAPVELLERFQIDPHRFNEYKVLPRLFFGEYLSAQFALLHEMAEANGIVTTINYDRKVVDIIDYPESREVGIEIENHGIFKFDFAIICTGHNWPRDLEEKFDNYFSSPYPPVKISLHSNHAVAIRGSSLTAIDAIRTLARKNGTFFKDNDGKLRYKKLVESPDFRLVMHSRNGLLPAVRFHLEDSHLHNDSVLTAEQIAEHLENNNGFLSLDYIFEKDFKAIIIEKDPAFYERFANMNIEEFVAEMMDFRERIDPFELLKAEFAEAEKSIKRHESIYWKEMLGVLSFAMNHPAKYLSAEDMQRLQKVLMPLISIVIAYVPQSSCSELIALHDAGVLDLVSVGTQSSVEPDAEKGGATVRYIDENGFENSTYYQTFVDCIGQPHLSYSDFPFKTLKSQNTISRAQVKFQSVEAGAEAFIENPEIVEKNSAGEYFLNISGIKINDSFQIVDPNGVGNERIYIMAVPYIGGYNPDYSGLDFSEAASEYIINSILRKENLSI